MAKFDALEKNLKAKLAQKAELTAMWKKLDFNGNNMCSLAEIDKWVDNFYVNADVSLFILLFDANF